MEALVLQLKESISDPNNELPVIGGWSFDLINQGKGNGVSKLSLTVAAETTISINNGEFFSDSTGVTSLGNRLQAMTGEVTCYIRLKSAKGRIQIDKAENILDLGKRVNIVPLVAAVGVFTECPYCELSLDNLPVNLISLINSEGVTSGDIKGLLRPMASIGYIILSSKRDNKFYGALTSDKTRALQYLQVSNSVNETTIDVGVYRAAYNNISGSNIIVKGALSSTVPIVNTLSIGAVKEDLITGSFADLKTRNQMSVLVLATNKSIAPANLLDLPSTLVTIQLNQHEGVNYTGTREWGNGFRALYIMNTTLPSATIDKILNELSVVTWSTTGTKVIALKGARTASSDNAVGILSNMGVTVTLLS
mgnify:CR=1 FL=1